MTDEQKPEEKPVEKVEQKETPITEETKQALEKQETVEVPIVKEEQKPETTETQVIEKPAQEVKPEVQIVETPIVVEPQQQVIIEEPKQEVKVEIKQPEVIPTTPKPVKPDDGLKKLSMEQLIEMVKQKGTSQEIIDKIMSGKKGIAKIGLLRILRKKN